MRKLLIFLVFVNFLWAESVPTDSLLNDKNISIFRKTAIFPIKVWQKISFSSSSMNCQFEPSCSQFTAISIAEHGVIGGSIIGADRIIRCNPMAHYYHTEIDSGDFHTDGRLYDPAPQIIKFHKPEYSLAWNLCPGLSRLKRGKPVDGMYSFLLTATFSYVSYSMNQKDHQLGAIIFATGGLTFWLSDFYDSFQK